MESYTSILYKQCASFGRPPTTGNEVHSPNAECKYKGMVLARVADPKTIKEETYPKFLGNCGTPNQRVVRAGVLENHAP